MGTSPDFHESQEEGFSGPGKSGDVPIPEGCLIFSSNTKQQTAAFPEIGNYPGRYYRNGTNHFFSSAFTSSQT